MQPEPNSGGETEIGSDAFRGITRREKMFPSRAKGITWGCGGIGIEKDAIDDENYVWKFSKESRR